MDNNQEIGYIFTKYLEVAVKRTRKDYLHKRYRKENLEVLSESDVEGSVDFEKQYRQMQEERRTVDSSYKWDWFLQYMECNAEEQVIDAMKNLREAEFEIVCLRVLEDMAFEKIAALLAMEKKRVVSMYYYALKKLRKELTNNGFYI